MSIKHAQNQPPAANDTATTVICLPCGEIIEIPAGVNAVVSDGSVRLEPVPADPTLRLVRMSLALLADVRGGLVAIVLAAVLHLIGVHV
jgi:hypothetical protein